MQEKISISSHKGLVVWQKAMALVTVVYRFTGSFPQEEKFGLVSQMRRAAVSIPSNIAEGHSRNTTKDFIQFLHIARGSLTELETQLDIAKNLSFGTEAAYNEAVDLLVGVRRMLIAMIASLKKK